MKELTYVSIGNVKIEKSACLAPMASVADRAYRQLCREYGASYVVSEMISSKGLFYTDRKTEELCTVTDVEKPMALQIFGEEAMYMAKAADKLMKYKPDIIDINMGCPVPKIVGSGSGSALMKDLNNAVEIAREVVKASECPVTVKIRAGWDQDNINAVDFAKALEQTGVSAIAVHGRTRNQFYSGKADWDIIKQVKDAVSCVVIGNGDVTNGIECEAMYHETGCDLVMVGRASYGRPWVFNEIRHYMLTGEIMPPISLEERMSVMMRHAKMICQYKGERQGMKEARKNIAWYIKGLPKAAEYRNKCGGLNELSDLKIMIDEILSNTTNTNS